MYNTTTRYIFPLYSSAIGPNDVDDGSPHSAENCYSPWLVTRGVFGITMIVIISLHRARAVRKRGEQHLDRSAEEWTDRRTVFRDVCGSQRRRNVRRRKSVRLASRNGEALADLEERAPIILEWYSNVFQNRAECNWQYGIPYCCTEHVMSIYWNVCLTIVTVTETCSNITLLDILLCCGWTTL